MKPRALLQQPVRRSRDRVLGGQPVASFPGLERHGDLSGTCQLAWCMEEPHRLSNSI